MIFAEADRIVVMHTATPPVVAYVVMLATNTAVDETIFTYHVNYLCSHFGRTLLTSIFFIIYFGSTIVLAVRLFVRNNHERLA